MGLGTVENVGDGFALIRSQSGHVDECLYLLVARRRDDGASISMADENDQPRCSLQRAIERRYIIVERCQRQRRRDHLDTVGRQRPDNLCPT